MNAVNNAMVVNVPQLPWYGDTNLELNFPSSWDVFVCHMAGQDANKLSEEEIQAAFHSPVGTKRIAQLARGKKEVVIIFDDLSRPTKAAELVPYVLQELKEGGINEKNIRFIAGIGAHGAMKLTDFVKKLDASVVNKYLVYNHNPFENCSYIGTTSRGTQLSINSEVMACDLKIAIGAIVPHPGTSFGGGAKMILPGVAHIDSIYANHLYAERVQPNSVESNTMRLDIEEAARMVGLDIIVNVVVNLYRETIGLFVGDVVDAHREGVKLAKQVYATKTPRAADIVVANTYCKANEGAVALQIGLNRMLKDEGGDIVLICNIPEGQICHYLTRSFGKNMGGRLWRQRTKLPKRTKRLIVLGTYVDRAGLDWIGPPEMVTLANSWNEILDILKSSYNDNAKVTVIPDATIQYFPDIW